MMQQSGVLAADDPMCKVELSISCDHLVNLDMLSKSDPMVILYVGNVVSGTWREFARTEMIRDNLNPKFVKTFQIDYRFEEIQPLRFLCYDVDNSSADLTKQDFIGEFQCKLADIVTAKQKTLSRPLKHPKHPNSKRGNITIIAEEVLQLTQQFTFRFAGKHLDKKDLFGKSDPYLVINKLVGDSSQSVPVLKTEVIMKTLDPQWKPFTIGASKLCGGDLERPLYIECYDWNRSGSHELIGGFKTSTRELISGQKKEFDLIDPKKQKKSSYRNSGVIVLQSCEVTKSYSFLDYISGGCEISLIVAIDFTASNGNPIYANSLHYNNPYEPNEYVKAISSIGSILADYDSDRNFPAYGFGAKLPPTMAVSHLFPLNGNPQNPEVHEISGILQVYQQALNSVTLYGPTIFTPVIQAASQIASVDTSQTSQKYFILLIITDGVINDMDETVDAIVRATNLPLSIVIVGVGGADFANMEILDADDKALRASNGEVAKRDIVQFVPMRNFKNAHPSVLAKEVLAEIPGQLLGFMKARGFVPNDPSSRSEKPFEESNFPFQFGVPGLQQIVYPSQVNLQVNQQMQTPPAINPYPYPATSQMYSQPQPQVSPLGQYPSPSYNPPSPSAPP